MTAEEFVQKYHDMTVPDFVPNTGGTSGCPVVGSRIIRAPVDEYCNTRFSNYYGKSHSKRWELRKTLIHFCEAQVADPDTPLYQIGAGYTLANSFPPLAYCDKTMIDDSFYGKGSPEMLWSTIHLLSYWRGWQRYVDGVATIAPVDDIVDKYLGMDCNGFVGNYLKAKYSDFRLGSRTPEEDYFYNRASVRNDVEEVQPDDVVLMLHEEGSEKIDWKAADLIKELSAQRFLVGHIAVISRVLSASGNTAQIVLCESRTRRKQNGGPQSNTWTLKRLGKYHFAIVGRSQPIHSVLRVKHT